MKSSASTSSNAQALLREYKNAAPKRKRGKIAFLVIAILLIVGGLLAAVLLKPEWFGALTPSLCSFDKWMHDNILHALGYKLPAVCSRKKKTPKT